MLEAVPALPDESQGWISVSLTRKGTSEPIGGEPITLFHRRSGEWPRIHAVESDEHGRAELPVPPSIPLAVSAGAWFGEDRQFGYARRELEPLSPGERRQVAIELPFGLDGVFWGRVVDAVTGKPIAGAQVAHGSVSSRLADTDVLARSDASGLVSLRFASWKYETMRIVAEGYGPAILDPEPGSEEPDRAQLLRLQRAAGLKIRVTGPAGARAVRLGAHLRELVVGSNAFASGEVGWSAELSRAGSCELLGLPARVPLRASVTRKGRSPYPIAEPLILEPGELREVEWRTSGVTVLGRLVDQEGLPIADTAMWIVKRVPAGEPPSDQALFDWGSGIEAFAESKTDEQGRFRFDDVLPGPWWIGPQARPQEHAPSDGAAPLATRVDVPENAPHHEIEIRSWRGLTIAGWLLDPYGDAVSGGSVDAHSEDFRGFVHTKTAEDGRFVLGPLAPGRYSVTATQGVFAAPEPVEARPGDEEVRLFLREGGAIRGRIIDGESGGGVATKEIWVLSRDPTGGGQGSRSDESGAFSVAALAPGVYDVSASTPSGLAGVIADLAVGQATNLENVIVELHRGARLTVRYTGPDPYARLRVKQGAAFVALDRIPRGASATHVVPAGALAVHVRLRSGEERAREVVLEPGEAREVVFDLE